MENERRSGECSSCYEESDRLFDSPLLNPDDWSKVEIDGDWAKWVNTDCAYKGVDFYDVVLVDGEQYLRGYECPDKPICWLCFNGSVSPCDLRCCVNKPSQIVFNGWKDPIWKDG